MNDQPLVAVVTPFFNTAAYLKECIESVLRQTYGNWEYILVDNCSTDGSGEMAASFASRFPARIRCLRTGTFLTQVANYNFALSHLPAAARYCKMVQADDWLFPDCVRSMVEVAEAHPSVGIVGAFELEGDRVSLGGLPYPSPCVPGREVGRLYFLKQAYLLGTPTSLLLRADLVRGRVPFFEQRYAPFEDGHACFDLLKTWDFGFVHQILTYSRRQDDSMLARLRPFGLVEFLRFSLLVAHGRDYLAEEEYLRCFRAAAREYFGFLALMACARRRQGREFWEFHRQGLAAINYPFTRRMLAKRIPRALVEKCWGLLWRTGGAYRPSPVASKAHSL
jgi:glycosyltransferase involved in cell wall biosynthesis